MKKVIGLIIALAISNTAFAQHHGHGHGHGRHVHGGYNWVAPAIIGGVIGYGLTRPYVYNPPVIVQQPQYLYQQPPVIYEQVLPNVVQPNVVQPNVVQPNMGCGPWTETQNSDGTITRSRTCSQ